MQKNTAGHPIIFFDGMCNLCNASVNFIISHDKTGHFKFAALQSDFASAFLKNFDYLKNKTVLPDSLILIEDDKIYFKSEAAIRIAGKMSGIWKTLIVLKVIPLLVRDWLYDCIANNRYKIFGKRQTCMVPTPDISKRFF